MKILRFLPFFLAAMLFFQPVNTTTAATYQETVLRDTPVVYYRFESADGGVIRDLSGNDRDGVLNAKATLAENSAAKELGKCLLLLGGRDDGVKVNNAGERKISFASRKISIEMWMLSTGNGHETLLGAEEWQDGMVILASSPDHSINLAVCGRNPNVVRFDFHSVAGFRKSRWNHLVVTYDAMLPKDNVRFYINGQCVQIATIGTPSPENREAVSLGESFTIGNHWADRGGGPRPFTGMMDEVAVYDKVLTPTQIKAHYLAAGKVLEADLEAVGLVAPQERIALLSEKSAWSYTFTKPTAKNWTTQYPLPKGGFGVGGQMYSDNWPAQYSHVWMTTKLTLPADYKPGNLYLSYRHQDSVIIFVNGTVVFQQMGHTIGEVYTRYIPNVLKPGNNYVAVYCEDNGSIKKAQAYVTLSTDDLPPLDATPLYSAGDNWSYTFDDPGQRWTTQYPLPRCKYGTGVFVSGYLWENGKRNIWLTRVVTLPANYKPEEMLVQFRSRDNIWVYVNGNEVLRRGSTHRWEMVREVKNFLKPGKNIIAVRCEALPGGSRLGVDMFIRKYTAEDKKHPLEGLQRPRTPDDVGSAAEGMMNQVAEEAKELTETEKKIQLGLNCLKLGQTELGISTLEKAAEADDKDFTANCILGMYALTKQDNAAKALTYFTKCVKVNPKDPSVLNNYGVTAMENKRFSLALESWERLAKIDPTLPVLGQNVGCMMDLLNKKRIVLKEPEQLRLVELYMTTCANQNRDRDPTLGFMLLPMQEGVGHRPDCDSVFVQEFKRGKETVTCQPYEVRKTYYGK